MMNNTKIKFDLEITAEVLLNEADGIVMCYLSSDTDQLETIECGHQPFVKFLKYHLDGIDFCNGGAEEYETDWMIEAAKLLTDKAHTIILEKAKLVQS